MVGLSWSARHCERGTALYPGLWRLTIQRIHLDLPFMPPRWPRKPDRRDPAYRRLEDRMNFALHVAIFAATNSGLWFAHQIHTGWVPWVGLFTPLWLAGLAGHGIYIFAIADYSGAYSSDADDSPQEGRL
jgi:hypothetical protein